MESRRGARVDTPFFVAIDGIDAEPTLRHGDISATGIYFETRRDVVGGAGTIHWLHLVSADRAKRIRAMAYVVRVVQLADASGETIGGIAFEFMPESDDAQAALHDFVVYVLANRLKQDEEAIEPRLDAQIGARDAQAAGTLRQLSVRSMVLETSWAIQPGEKVRVDIVAPGMTRRIRLDGRAIRVVPKVRGRTDSSFDIEVEVQNETERPLRTHSSMTFQAVRPEDAAASPPPPAVRAPNEDAEVTAVLDDLLAALILPPEQEGPRTRRDFLSGKLAQVRLPTLLSLIEMERMTGKLVLRRGVEEARLYVADGVVLDVEPLDGSESRRARIGALMAWDDGTFELNGEPVTRPNRINMRTTALILDLARESDEATRDA